MPVLSIVLASFTCVLTGCACSVCNRWGVTKGVTQKQSSGARILLCVCHGSTGVTGRRTVLMDLMNMDVVSLCFLSLTGQQLDLSPMFFVSLSVLLCKVSMV